MDLFTTSLRLAGVEVPTDRPIDGVDMALILFSNGKSKRLVEYYYYGDQIYAVRKGPFKAHFTTHDGYSKEEPVKHNPPQLFNLPEDPSERFDVAAEHPDVVAELTQIAEERRATVTRGKLRY